MFKHVRTPLSFGLSVTAKCVESWLDSVHTSESKHITISKEFQSLVLLDSKAGLDRDSAHQLRHSILLGCGGWQSQGYGYVGNGRMQQEFGTYLPKWIMPSGVLLPLKYYHMQMRQQLEFVSL